MLELKRETGSFGLDKFFNGTQKRGQKKTFFVKFICNKLLCYFKFENNEIFTINNDNTLTLL